MRAKIKEAEELLVKALALLDAAGELQAAPYIDMAIHELKRSLEGAQLDGNLGDTGK